MEPVAQLHVGCPSWAHRPWVGRFLPADTRPGSELHAYSRCVNAVEGNTTFYASPQPATVAKWASQASAGFRFIFKVPQTITHHKRLRDIDDEMRAFLDLIEPLHSVVGALTLLFLAQRLLFPSRVDAAPPPRWLGFLLGTASGFTSFVAHAGGPPIMAFVLPLRLSPITFTATMATFFAAVNLSKWLPYAWLGLIDWRNMATALVLVPLAPLGVWLGVRMVRHIRPDWFYRLAYSGMFLTGVKLLWDGVH